MVEFWNKKLGAITESVGKLSIEGTASLEKHLIKVPSLEGFTVKFLDKMLGAISDRVEKLSNDGIALLENYLIKVPLKEGFT